MLRLVRSVVFFQWIWAILNLSARSSRPAARISIARTVTGCLHSRGLNTAHLGRDTKVFFTHGRLDFTRSIRMIGKFGHVFYSVSRSQPTN